MNNKYSFSEVLKNAYSLIMTKIFFCGARLIRRPIYIRGKKSLSYLHNLTTGRLCRFDLDGEKKTLFFGENCQIGDMTHIVAHERVEIGNNVLIASKCFISDTNHGTYKGEKQSSPNIPPNERCLECRPVKIGDNVWIGENVVILPGVNIGDGCVIGANSVVNRNVEDFCMVAGSPIKIIKIWNIEKKEWRIMKNENSI